MILPNLKLHKELNANFNAFSTKKNKKKAIQLPSPIELNSRDSDISKELGYHSNADNVSTLAGVEGIQSFTDAVSVHYQNTDVLSAEQLAVLAKQMENSRATVTELLINSEKGLAELSEEFSRQSQLGIDLSELVNKTISDNNKPVQKNNSVQDKPNQFKCKLFACFDSITEKSNNPALAAERSQAISFLREIHFLPNFLLQISTNICLNNSADELELRGQIKQQSQILNHARQVMINGNLRLVRFIARQYKNQSMSFSDLIQEGTIGLIKAVDRYDYRRSVRFSTYAIHWIRQAINRAMVRQKNIVRLPYNIAEKSGTVFHHINESLTHYNKWPSTAELAVLCQMPEEEIKAIIQNYQPTVSLNNNLNDDEEMPEIGATLEQRHFPQPLSHLASSALHKLLRKAVASLNEREAAIINCRFGLRNNHEMTLQDVGSKYSLTRERVRQIQNAALLKLKNNFNNDLSDFLESG